jgi:chromosome segregation ATPase
MSRSASHKSKAADPSVAELLVQLEQAHQALRDERASHEQESENFVKALARLGQSERALSQAQAKVVRAEARAEQAEAEVKSLRSEASDLHTAWTELSLNGAPLQQALDACRRDLAAAETRVDALTHERTRLLDVLASLEVLGREISQLTSQATAEGTSLPKSEWLGRDVEAEHVRATVRPEGMSAAPPKAPRAWSTPEILVDGVKLESS